MQDVDPRFDEILCSEPLRAGDPGAGVADIVGLGQVLQDVWPDEGLSPKGIKRETGAWEQEDGCGHQHGFLEMLAAQLSAATERMQRVLSEENDNTVRLVEQRLGKRGRGGRRVHAKQAFPPEQPQGLPPPGPDGGGSRASDVDRERLGIKSRSPSLLYGGGCEVRGMDSAGTDSAGGLGVGQELVLPGEIESVSPGRGYISSSCEMETIAARSTCSNEEVFHLREVWADHNSATDSLVSKQANHQLPRLRVSTHMNMVNSPNGVARGLTFAELKKKPKRWILHPNSGPRAVWDCASLLLLVYDVVMIPLEFFELPATLFVFVMAWVTRCFWTLDILASLSTGFLLHNGSIEMDPSRIAWRYLKGWATFDFLIVGTDWLEIFWTTSGSLGYARLGKSVRAIRILRMVRLLRLFRMRQAINLILERLRSERLIVITEILQVTVFVLASSHLNACFWYGVGNSGSDGAWVASHLEPERSFAYRYTVSLHWSLSQLSGGMDEVRPQNVGERVYNIIVHILGFIMAAVCIGGLGASLTRLNMLTNRQAQQQASLRRFLCENKVSNKLAVRILRNANFSFKERQRFMQESEVDLLSMVSLPLQCELHFEMFAPVMRMHPFLNRYIEACPHVMLRICHHAASMLIVSQGDIVFFAGETPVEPRMYFVCSGTLKYTSMQGDITPVTVGMWVAEAVLWLQWMHRGQFEALSNNCRLCTVDATKFQEIVCHFEHVIFDPRAYARQFVEDINAVRGEVSDLHIDNMGNKSLATRSVDSSIVPRFIFDRASFGPRGA